MQIHRNEVATGILVLVTAAFLVAVLIVIGMPGVISPVNVYRVYFDNASGIRPGAPVLLAGREIGKVSEIHSPIPVAKRPKGHADYEVAIDVKVDQDARIYNNTIVRLKAQSLMGSKVIDFARGDEKSQLAKDGKEFVGERVPEIAEALTTGFKQLTGEGSDFAATLRNTRDFTDTIKREPWRILWPSSKEYPEDKKAQKKK